MQVFGGWLGDRVGGRWLFGGGIAVCAALTLLTPPAARLHVAAVIVLRILEGAFEGFMLPATHALMSRWTPPAQSTRYVSVVFSGQECGIVVGMLLAGVLSDHGFAGGWPSVFYVFGAAGCLFAGAWFLLVHDSPSIHPRISADEREYWARVTGTADAAEPRPPISWRTILASGPVWALAVAFFANAWGFNTLAACIPLFMHDVLGFHATANGVFSAVPFLAAAAFMIPAGWLADWLRAPGRLSTTVVRKLFLTTGFLLAACLLVLTGYAGCRRVLTVALLFLAVASTCLSYIVVVVNQLDLEPLHAGKIMGLTFCFASVAKVAAPHVVGAMTYHSSTRAEWQNIFFLAAGIYTLGAVVFVVFGSGRRQNWHSYS